MKETEAQYENEVQSRMKRHYGKFVAGFLIMIVVALAIFIGFRMYDQSQAGQNTAEENSGK